MHSPVRALTGALMVVVLMAAAAIGACSLDESGLAGSGRGGAGNTGGSAAPDASGTAGSGAGGGDAGRGGMSGGAGASGGGGGAAAIGIAGMGGTSGAAGATACNACANCFRCGTQGACEPTPSARWTVICQSAVIAAMKPNGMTWDAPPPATSGIEPDTLCELTIDDDSGETTVVTDSLAPIWNQAVNPDDGETVTASLLMSAQNRWSIAIIDRDIQPPGSTEIVCQSMPRLTADDLQRGTVALTTGSCMQINLGLTCDEN
jgi:hypothetical protein